MKRLILLIAILLMTTSAFSSNYITPAIYGYNCDSITVYRYDDGVIADSARRTSTSFYDTTWTVAPGTPTLITYISWPEGTTDSSGRAGWSFEYNAVNYLDSIYKYIAKGIYDSTATKYEIATTNADTAWKSLVTARNGVAGSFADSSLTWGATSASVLDSGTVQRINNRRLDSTQNADAIAISGSSTAADNLEEVFDGDDVGADVRMTQLKIEGANSDGSFIVTNTVNGPVTYWNSTVVSPGFAPAFYLETNYDFGLIGNVSNALIAGDIVGDVTGDRIGNITGNLSGSVGSVTGAVGSVTGAVGSVTAGVTVTTNNDKTGYALTTADWNVGKTGYSLSAAGIDDFYDEDTAGHATAQSFGVLWKDTSAYQGSGAAIDYEIIYDTIARVIFDSTAAIAELADTIQDISNKALDSTQNADAIAISGDATAADNFETMLDGTGGETLSLGQLNVVASGNDDAIIATGSGTGRGILATGGATGHGFEAVGGVTSGHGIRAWGQTDGYGAVFVGTNDKAGLRVSGGANDGNGFEAVGGATNSHGFYVEGQGAGAGAYFYSGTSGNGIHTQARTSGNGHGFYASGAGGGNGHGAYFVAGSGTGGRGIKVAGDEIGIEISGSDTGMVIDGLINGIGIRSDYILATIDSVDKSPVGSGGSSDTTAILVLGQNHPEVFYGPTTSGPGLDTVKIWAVDTSGTPIAISGVTISFRNLAGGVYSSNQITQNGYIYLTATAGDTVILLGQKLGYVWSTFDTVFVTGPGTDTLNGYDVAISSPSGADVCVVFTYITDIAGNPVKGGLFTVTSVGDNVADTCNGGIPVSFTRTAVSDVNGLAEVSVIKSKCLTGGGSYSATAKRSRRGVAIYNIIFTVPDQNSYNILTDR